MVINIRNSVVSGIHRRDIYSLLKGNQLCPSWQKISFTACYKSVKFALLFTKRVCLYSTDLNNFKDLRPRQAMAKSE